MSNPWISCTRRDTQAQVDAAAGKPFLLIWIHELRIFAPFPATEDGLRDAQRTLVQQWNAVRAPLTTTVATIADLERRFCIRRIAWPAADEIVCTLQDALPHA